MARFTGKSVIVTGGASGIGRSTALAFAAEGAKVMVADQNGAGAEAVAEAIRAAGGMAASFRADISLYVDCQALVDHAVARFGGLHVAFNNAGIPGSMTKAVHEYDLEEWNRMITVNLTGVFHSLKAEVPAMLASGGGAIINTASVATSSIDATTDDDTASASFEVTPPGSGSGCAGDWSLLRPNMIREPSRCERPPCHVVC